ncbi:unnamed protein product [Lactuca saligna]|uniref:Uncharacterized protein n=1 Tax=Lactuca saligna TaxID=75948 RepID=A0AA35YIU8_LACSI|nr:unnamed protein product [Lactuca saligna]
MKKRIEVLEFGNEDVETATLSDSDPTFFLHNHNHLLNLDLSKLFESYRNHETSINHTFDITHVNRSNWFEELERNKGDRLEVSLLCTWYNKISPN